MAEELKNLLERIQKDGVERAEADGEKILTAAREKAKTITSEAEKKAKAILEKAEKDGEAFTERGRKSLEQASRDVLLSVGDAVFSALKRVVESEVSKAMTDDTLKKMLVEVVGAYSKQGSKDSRIEVLLNADSKSEIAGFFMQKFKEEMKKGVDIKTDNSVVSGFKVSIVNDKIEHDFSSDAITEALCQLLRPHIAEIVRGTLKTKE